MPKSNEEGSPLKTERSQVLLESLNPEQRRAVQCVNGPVLVLAGAGSGKTRVLTHRIAYLIEEVGVAPESVLAVTFTNKAAQEMRERVARLISRPVTQPYGANALWIGTFHSICARILRADAGRLGFSRQFTIYDSEDQLAMIRQVMEQLDIPPEQLPANYLRHRISRAKNAFITPADFFDQSSGSFKDETIAGIYKAYQKRLAENNAMDFDDLLLYPIKLFKEHPHILANYQRRFRYLLVDEFQDTNRAQYVLLKALTGPERNLFVVGDDDQSIYRWRGADLRNILEFEADYPDCKTFRLEQNYRSTRNILGAAHSVVVRNQNRMDKQLWTTREEGEKVLLLEAGDERHEAQIIYDKISEEFGRQNGSVRSHRLSFRDFAVLYRTNAQSRLLEDVLRRNGVPHIIVGGLRFYERKEVKDVLAYLRLASNQTDSISLRRVINYPLRGIGKTTIGRIEEFARSHNLGEFDALGRVEEIPSISASMRKKVLAFHQFISKYVCLKDRLSLQEWCNALVGETNIIELLKQEGAQERIANIRELLNAINEYAVKNSDATIEGFLEQVSLITDVDNWDRKSNAVTLMTLHSAKGLEFPIVFMVGVEEGLFPLIKPDEDPDLEEERRLFYVGATRAQEKLYVSYALSRSQFGREPVAMFPSRFIQELDPQYLQHGMVRRQRYRQPAERYETEAVMPDYENESQENGALRPGQWVMHDSFGRGRIRSAEGTGERMKVTIDFDKCGSKKIMVKYGNLRFI